jgi:hypothetical protein
MRYDERPVHEHVMIDGLVGELAEPLIHYPYASLGEYFAKLDRYSRWWAEQNFARGRRDARVDDRDQATGAFLLDVRVARRVPGWSRRGHRRRARGDERGGEVCEVMGSAEGTGGWGPGTRQGAFYR